MITEDQLHAGLVIHYTQIDTKYITPIKTKRKVRVVNLFMGSVYYRLDDENLVKDTSVNRFLDIINKGYLPCDCERSHNGFGMAGRACDCEV